MGNLSNLYISQSFQSLIHLATNNTASATLIELEDGYGNPLGLSVNTRGDLSVTSSITLYGPQVFSNGGNASSLVTRSGSIVFVGNGFTSASADLAHISSSGNFVNFFMKNNNNTADTVISGSGNIFVNPATPTAGFKRFMTGGNISVGGTGAGVPQISASMAWSPIIANNIFANSSTPISFRGPVSSSLSTLNNNIFANGTLALGTPIASFERAINGTTFNGNILNGTVTATAFKTAFISSSAMSMTGNMIGGTLNPNADSSSISLANNTFQSSLTINNSYYNPSATGGGNSFGVSGGNGIFGSNHSIFVSGSNTSNSVGRQFISNFFSGVLISASANLNGNNSNIIATSVMGHGLSITGSSALIQTTTPTENSFGSAFVGRWNALDGTKARTGETVFAVGTGTTTNRKTGFLIDSGSNTFVEGSLNVSGSTTLSGSLNVSGSITIQSGSGDLYVHGHKQFNCGAWQDTTTQSGSANTAYAFKFNTVDILDGVFLSGSTGLQAGAAGIYNIQWSGQLVQGASSADVTVWLRKNRFTDVPGSAGRVTVPSNTKALPAWNYMLELNANDVIELMWASTSNNTTWEYIPAATIYPSCASIIVTISQVR